MRTPAKYLARRAAALAVLALIFEALALAVDADRFTGLHLVAAAVMWGAVLLAVRAFETTVPAAGAAHDL